MSWRILYIEESDNLSLYLDNIKVKKGNNEFLFPLSDILSIVIDNYKTSLTVHLMNACSSRNIPLIFCDDSHHPLTIVLPLYSHYECAKIHKYQVNNIPQFKETLWAQVVYSKINNQLYVLKKINKDLEAIKTLETYLFEIELNDKTNREGLAAKVYFHSLFSMKFSRQDDNDVINACLNYGYSILRSMIAKIVIAKGLNTQLGIFHKSSGNYFNLVDDLMEPFRPIVDYYVYTNYLEEKIFKKEHRLALIRLFTFKIKYENQMITISHFIETYVDRFIKILNGKENKIIEFEPILYDL